MANRGSNSNRGRPPYQKPVRSDFKSESQDTPTGKLAISNLHYEVDVKDLLKIFSPFGQLVKDPFIRYDRSGRSTGFAIVEYTTLGDAQAAKAELDGAKAKGQDIHIRFDTSRPRAPKAEGGSSNGPGLLSRIGKAPLLHRLAGQEAGDSSSTPRSVTGPGPVRTPRGGPQRAVSSGNPRSGRGGRVPRPAPKTAGDLDKELEDFMDDKKDNAAPLAEAADGDVAMDA